MGESAFLLCLRNKQLEYFDLSKNSFFNKDYLNDSLFLHYFTMVNVEKRDRYITDSCYKLVEVVDNTKVSKLVADS